MGDLDGDRDHDLIVTGGAPVVLENVGGARFVVSTTIVLTGVGTQGFGPRIRDFDGDGRLDVLFANGKKLLLAQGGGKFVDVTATNLPAPVPAYGGKVADIDLDGDVDFFSAMTLWLNDGKGVFSDASARMTGSFKTALAVVDDLDADGDPDLYSLGDNRVYMNFHRQIDAVARPELGKTYGLDFHIRPVSGCQNPPDSGGDDEALLAVAVPGSEPLN